MARAHGEVLVRNQSVAALAPTSTASDRFRKAVTARCADAKSDSNYFTWNENSPLTLCPSRVTVVHCTR